MDAAHNQLKPLNSYVDSGQVVEARTTQPGTPLHNSTYKSSNNQSQQWALVNNCYLQNLNSGLYMEIADSDPNDGAVTQINGYTGNANQQWSICGDGFIRSLMNGNVLGVAGGTNAPGSPVISWHPEYPNAFDPPRDQYWFSDIASRLSCQNLVTVVKNDTPNGLFIQGDAGYGTVMAYGAHVQSMPPGSVAVYVSEYIDGNEVSFTVMDYDIPGAVVTFDVHQHWCDVEAGKVWADSFSSNNRYYLNSPATGWYAGAVRGLPGIITASVERSSQ
jgi:hypothetical protein